MIKSEIQVLRKWCNKKAAALLSVLITALVLMSFLVLDPWVKYKMCTWCFVERMILVALMVLLLGMVFMKAVIKECHGYVCAAILSFIGLQVSVYHAYLVVVAQGVHGCGMMLDLSKLKRKAGGGYYKWVECSSGADYFLGLNLIWWALGLFAILFTVFLICAMREYQERKMAKRDFE